MEPLLSSLPLPTFLCDWNQCPHQHSTDSMRFFLHFTIPFLWPLPMKKSNGKGRERLPPTLAPLTSVVLHSSVVGDTLWSKTEAQDIARIRAVSYQEGTIWFPFQLHLCIFPIHWSPIPTTLSKTQRGQVVNRTEKCQFRHKPAYRRRPHFQAFQEVKAVRAINIRLRILLNLQSRRRILQFHYHGSSQKRRGTGIS